MCGIAGYISLDNSIDQIDLNVMSERMKHRGPDAKGEFISENKKIGLAHRRLSILDLSESANQPFYSSCGKYVMIFNGEIYNFQELKNKFQIDTKTDSDTEVLIELFSKLGIEMLHELNGMFAIVIFDKKKQKLFLIRDRIGIKPLFYTLLDDNNVAFASEVKSLEPILSKRNVKSLNIEAVKDYFFLEYTPGIQTVFDKCFKLEPGTYIKFNFQNSLSFTKHKYYDLIEKRKEVTQLSMDASGPEHFKNIITDSIKYRKTSDVPVGSFLSGGVDSSLISAVFQEVTQEKITSFNIGFNETAYDESAWAQKVSDQIKSVHYHSKFSETDILNLTENLYDVYDLPFASESTLATMMVSKFARKNVKVALSGDGGDELYMGYGYYDWYNRAKRFRMLGKSGRGIFTGILGSLGGKYYRAGKKINYPNKKNFWPHVWSQEQLMFNENEISELFQKDYEHQTLNRKWEKMDHLNIHDFEKISLLDLTSYLPENLLYKVDMASMGEGLEVRVPFLDHRVVEFAIASPIEQKNDSEKKILLKKVLENYISKDLIYRQKWGFPAPVKLWLNGPLKYLIDNFLNEDLLRRQGLFNVKMVKGIVDKYTKGQTDLGKKIWTLINFQLWYNRYFSELN